MRTEDNTSRSRILLAASTLLQEQGYHGTGINQIIEHSKTPKGSLYHYFPGGKEELVAAAIQTSADNTLSNLSLCLDTCASAEQGLNRFVEGWVQTLKDSEFKRGCPISTVTLEAAQVSDTIQAVCCAFFAGVENRIKVALERDGHRPARAEALANLILCGFEGALVQCKARRSTQPLQRFQQTIVSFLGTI